MNHYLSFSLRPIPFLMDWVEEVEDVEDSLRIDEKSYVRTVRTYVTKAGILLRNLYFLYILYLTRGL